MSAFLSERTMIVILTSLAFTGIRCQSTVSDEPHFVEKLERCEKGRFVETADYAQRMSQMHELIHHQQNQQLQAIQMLQENMQNISNRLERVIQDTTCLRRIRQQSPQQVRDKCGHTTMVRYYDIQFLFPPLLQCRPREELVCELRAICNPLLIQQNVNVSNFFDRTWEEFKVGFNDSNGNYWLGNELLHQLTMNNTYKLRFDLQSRDNNSLWFWAEYSTFTVGSETTDYTLQVGGFSGNVYEDALSDQNGMKFTTKDRDNDMNSGVNCAQRNVGGFWYDKCGLCSVNAGNSGYYNWYRFTHSFVYVQTSRMWLMCR